METRAQRIRLVITDVDGVLTDGGVYYGPEGEVMKRFSIRDGMGVERLRNAGIQTAIMTGENSPSVARRAEKLKITHALLGTKEKRQAIDGLLTKLKLDPAEVAYIGDDVNDLEVMQYIREHGVTATPNDAEPQIIETAHIKTTRRGGHGAFREFAEWLLEARR